MIWLIITVGYIVAVLCLEIGTVLIYDAVMKKELEIVENKIKKIKK